MQNSLLKNVIKLIHKNDVKPVELVLFPLFDINTKTLGSVYFNQNFLKGKVFLKKLKLIFFNKKLKFFKLNKRFSIGILREVFFEKKRLRYKKSFTFIKNLLFSKNVSNYEITFFIKKLLISFLSNYGSHIERLKFGLKQSRRPRLDSFIYLRIRRDSELLKRLLFLINSKKVLKNKTSLNIQKGFFLFLLKNRFNIVDKKQKYYLNKLLLAYIKQAKKFTFTKQNFLSCKRVLSAFYLGRKKNLSGILYQKLVGLVNKKGEKLKALKIIETALRLAHLRLKMPVNLVLYRVFGFLKSSVELKKVRVRRSFHFVPFPINSNRKSYLVAKWIFLSIKKSKLKKSMEEKLYLEFFKVLKTKKSSSQKSRKYNIYKSLQNKSNSHFRW
jgi:ribosomal protein S7